MVSSVLWKERMNVRPCAGTFELILDMLTLNQPTLTQHISIPKDMGQLSCEAFTAGVVEGVLDGLDMVCLSPIRKLITTARTSDSAYGSDGSVPTKNRHPHQARQGRDGS